MTRRAALLLPVLLLATGCGRAAPADELETPSEPGELTEPVPAPPVPVGPSADDRAALENRDCTAVVTAFAGALQRKATAYADLFWHPQAEGKAGFDALLAPMVAPQPQVGSLGEEGAAGSLYCTVDLALADGGTPAGAVTTARLVLKRVNDVDGATAQQLRWTIRSATIAPEPASVLAH